MAVFYGNLVEVEVMVVVTVAVCVTVVQSVKSTKDGIKEDRVLSATTPDVEDAGWSNMTMCGPRTDGVGYKHPCDRQNALATIAGLYAMYSSRYRQHIQPSNNASNA